MSFIRKKIVNNNTYYYRVKSVREGGKVKQKFVEYLGKTPPGIAPGTPPGIKPKVEKKEKPMDIKEFSNLVTDSIKIIDKNKMFGGSIPLPDLKQLLMKEVDISEDEVNKKLIQLEKDGIIFLEPVNDPYSLKPERREKGFKINEERGLLFYAQLRESKEDKEMMKKFEKETPVRPQSQYANVNDINFQTAYDGYRNTSFSPEIRASQIQNEYVREIDQFANNIMDLAETKEQKELAKLEIQKYRDGYLNRMNTILGARSRTASTMITGGANFPTQRNRKALDREHKLSVEFSDWNEKAIKRSKKNVINAFEGDISKREFEIMKKTIDRDIEVMKSIDSKGKYAGFDRSAFVNSLKGKLERNLKNGNIKLVEDSLKYIKEQEKGLKKPVFSTRHSIFKKLETAKAKPPEITKTGSKILKTYNGAKIINNFDAERIQLDFDEKPNPDVIKNLKSNGWHWSRSEGVWQRKNTRNAEFDSKILLDKHFDES